MADPGNSTPSTPVGTADVGNASALVESVSVIRQALSTGSDAIVTAITAIATAVTQSLLGGVVGTTTNMLLKSKTVSSGSSAGSLQATGITCDGSNNLSGIGGITAVFMELGSTVTPLTPFIDFHSSGNNIDYDARIIASGGSGSVGTGTLNFDCTTLTKSSVGIATLNTNGWLQQQGFGRIQLTDASTIAWNVQTQQTALVVLTAAVGGTRVLGAPSNMVSGYTYILMVVQSAGGGNALTYNGVYKWPNGVAPTLSVGGSQIDILTFFSDGTNMYGVAQKAFS